MNTYELYIFIDETEDKKQMKLKLNIQSQVNYVQNIILLYIVMLFYSFCIYSGRQRNLYIT